MLVDGVGYLDGLLGPVVDGACHSGALLAKRRAVNLVGPFGLAPFVGRLGKRRVPYGM